VHGSVNVLAPIQKYFDALVHPSARHDALMAARHRAFIAPRLLGSFGALAAFPVYLVVRGVPSALEVGVFAWFVAPILIAYYLLRTGRYEGAHVLSSLALAGLVTSLAIETGGIQSFAAVWLIVVPLEAALSGSRRVVAIASSITLSAGVLLVGLGFAHALPAAELRGAQPGALAALGIVSAIVYATGLALGAEALTRTSARLLNAEENRYRMLADNMTDVFTRHGRNGGVLFASPAAELLFGSPVHELLGHGLFDRVHIADRPTYLTALADTAARSESRLVEFRVRRDDAEAGVSPAIRFIWIEMRCRPLDGAMASQAGEVVAVMRDVSERKQQEQALEDERAGAECANVARSRFLAAISNELRPPLSDITRCSEMLMAEDVMTMSDGRRRDCVKLINDSSHHLLSLVNGILDVSKIDAGEFPTTPEPLEAAEIIDDAPALPVKKRA
jgi:cell cycle sensor histidine kinase DivJ